MIWRGPDNRPWHEAAPAFWIFWSLLVAFAAGAFSWLVTVAAVLRWMLRER